MKRSGRILVVVAASALLGWLAAGSASGQDGTVRGRFVTLAEKQVGEQEYLTVVVQPGEGKEDVSLLVRRDSDLAGVARRLRKGQVVEVAFVTEAGQKWARRIGEGAKVPAVRGQFVTLAEKQVGEREHLAVVVQVGEGKEQVFLVQRRSDLAGVAARLRKGQMVEIAYVTEAGQNWARRIGTGEKAAAVRGRFLTLAEKQVGERECLAVVVQPGEGMEEVALLVPREGELAAAARRLQKGQVVEIAYVTAEGQKWIRRIGAARGEGAGLREELAKLRQHLAQMEKQLKELREENARLREKLRELEAAKKPPAEKAE